MILKQIIKEDVCKLLNLYVNNLTLLGFIFECSCRTKCYIAIFEILMKNAEEVESVKTKKEGLIYCNFFDRTILQYILYISISFIR